MNGRRGTHIARLTRNLDGTWRFNVYRLFPGGGEALCAMGICDFPNPEHAKAEGTSVAEHVTFMMGWSK